jgi:hypothetical protein
MSDTADRIGEFVDRLVEDAIARGDRVFTYEPVDRVLELVDRL